MSGIEDLTIQGFLEDHVLFRNLERSFIKTLANAMQSRVYNANEYIIRKGEIGKAMFFIQRGEVQVISEDEETILNVMGEQSFFGEIGVLFSVPRTASCRADGRCLILVLTKDKLASILAAYPAVAASINMIAEERFAMHIKQQEAAVRVEFGQEIHVAMTSSDLRNIPLFRDCEIGFLHNLALKLKPLQFQRQDLIIYKGDVASEMFFVVSGIAEVYREDDGKTVAEFQPGTFFGEVGLFFQIKRTASVRAGSLLTVFKLTKDDLEVVLKQYPEIDEKIKAEAKHRLEYNQIREKAKLSNTQEIPLFRNGTNVFYDELALALKLKLYEPKDLIIQKNSVGDSMFFVMDGTACVVSENGETVYGEITSGSFFGEVALFYEVNRTATVRARTVCTCFELSKGVLDRILKQYPEMEEAVREKARQNYVLFLARENAIKIAAVEDTQRFTEEATIERLKQVSTFQKCSHSFLKSLANLTTIHTHKLGTTIIRSGDPSQAMFFIATGRVEIVSSDESTVFDILDEGQFFGEVGLIKNIARSANVRVGSASCVVIELSKGAVATVLTEYPDAYEMIALEAEKRFKVVMNRKAGKELPVKEDETGSTSSLGSTFSGGSGGSGKGFFKRPSWSEGVVAADSRQGRRRSLSEMFRKFGKKSVDDVETMLVAKVSSPAQSVESVKTDEPEKSAPLSKIIKSFKSRFHKKEQEPKVSANKVQPAPAAASVPSSPEPSVAKTAKGEMVVTQAQSGRKKRTGKRRDHIFSLPMSVLMRVVEYLNPRHRLRLEGTCRKWFKLMADSHFWRKLDLFPIFTVLSNKHAVGLLHRGGSRLVGVNLNTCWMLQDEDLMTLASKSPHITYLGLSNCWKLTDFGINYVATGLEQLRQLDISYCGQITGVGFSEHCWGNLEQCDMSYCKQMTDDMVEKFLRGTKSIKDLRLRRCVKLTDHAIFLVVREIKYLDLGDCDKVTDKCLKWISSGCTNLKSLRLSFCSRITNNGLFDLSTGSYSFEALDLSHCTQVTDVSVALFAESLHSLRRLNLRRCVKVTDATVALLLRNAPLLERLDVSGCPLVTGGAVAALRSAAAGSARRPPLVVVMDTFRSGSRASEVRRLPKPREVPMHLLFTSGVPKTPPPPPSSGKGAKRGKKIIVD
ncbi:hypothetical protein DFJ73DRAFT_781474 [Zopfochytrium polystomum]|nr:hypothetical protein DFJ73DRAFT_781474 [Zopfochytrium polystomum]